MLRISLNSLVISCKYLCVSCEMDILCLSFSALSKRFVLSVAIGGISRQQAALFELISVNSSYFFQLRSLSAIILSEKSVALSASCASVLLCGAALNVQCEQRAQHFCFTTY